jgi:methionyl-tRNA formyltransferase
MGTPEFSEVVLERLVLSGYNIVACFTKPDKPSGRHMVLTASPVKKAALSHNIPVYQPASLRNPECETLIQSLTPDLIVTAAYGKILPESILMIPVRGCLNVHASLLPKYRGAAPIQWSILNGETETGITIMMMDKGMDTGDILTQDVCAISESINSSELTVCLASIGAELLIQTIPGFLSGEIIPVPQIHSEATYAPPILKDQGLINWNTTSQLIHNQIRGLSDWPGASTLYRGSRLKVHCSALPVDSSQYINDFRQAHGEPTAGTILCAKKDIIAVMCQDSCLLLTCIQPESCRRMNASECAHNFKVSDVLGGEV